MNKRRIKMILTFFSLSFLVSCQKTYGWADYAYSGGWFYIEGPNANKNVMIDVKTLKEQTLNASFEIEPGNFSYFAEEWEKAKEDFSIGKGSFAVGTYITSKTMENLCIKYTFLNEFPDRKYLVYTHSIQDADIYDFIDTKFKYSYEEKCDFSLFDAEEGYIRFYLSYYDIQKGRQLIGADFNIESGVNIFCSEANFTFKKSEGSKITFAQRYS